MNGYFEAIRQTFEDYGYPESIYADGLSTFFSSKPERLSIEEQLDGIDADKTQFSRIMDSLGIEMIHARSPQAKGRIERLWRTFQSRLPVEFAINNITNITQANEFLRTYLRDYNNEFMKDPISDKSYFVPMGKEDLDEILAVKFIRKVDASGCFQLKKVVFRVDDLKEFYRGNVEILINTRIGMKAKIKGKIYSITPLSERNKSIANKSDSINGIFERFVYHNLLKDEKKEKGVPN